MADDTPNSALALAVGNLTGNVSVLTKMLENQDKASAVSRAEIMDIFKGVRDDNKEQAEYLKKHIEEDAKVNQAVLELMTWKLDAKSKVDTLWDTKNRQAGAMTIMGILGSFVGGAFVAGIEWLKK